MSPTSSVEMTSYEAMTWLSAHPWRIERSITDRRAKDSFTFSGVAEFFKHSSLWIYREQGQLITRTQTLHMNREHLYTICDDSIQVAFDDGRPFYFIACEKLPKVAIHHLCGRDEYKGVLTLEVDVWHMQWDVHGPSKDYSVLTRYFSCTSGGIR